MANDDRVNELYRGEIFSARAQRECRDRIHWMCAQLQGERVLDIGCSQGIASILAAREGFSVVGVDVEQPAIEFAETELAREPTAVRDRVRLICADIFDLSLETDFDTVMLGEVLEHQANPRQLFARACELLAPGGIVVVATPFGLHVHHDHKSTFFLGSFLDTVAGLCKPRTLAIADSNIRFTAHHVTSSEAEYEVDFEALLSQSEEAFLQKEWRNHETLQDRTERLKRAMDSEEKALREMQRLARRATSLNQLITRLRAQQPAAPPTAPSPPAAPPPATPATVPVLPSSSPVIRGLDALNVALRREIGSGRIRAKTPTSARYIYAQVRSAIRGEPPAPTQSPPRKPKQVTYAPWQPAVTPVAKELTIATILDTFSDQCFQYEANLVRLTREGWREQMEQSKPAFLFAESAWRGNGGDWKYLMTKYAEKPESPLRELLAWCAEQGVPRVFWNKEDPANFEVFKGVAADFDYVFTTDEDCVPRYRELLGHDRIYALPFAAQPAIHNPIQDHIPRRGKVCFAGSWRADKYPERVADTQALLDAALPLDLDIFDRFHGTPDAETFAFPEPYADAVRGSLDYDRMLSAYRAYQTFLNVNSVQQSPTMFSRRVFELMACGTPVVSSDSLGIRTMLGTLVKIATSKKQARAQLEQLLGDDDYRERFAHAGYREVLENHTYAARLRSVMAVMGRADRAPLPPRVTVLAPTNRPDRLNNLLANVRRQTYPNLEIILLLNSERYDAAAVKDAARGLPNLRVITLPESYTLAECLNRGVEASTGAWVAKFDDDDHYGAHYLSDLWLPTTFTDAAIIGKRSYYCYLQGTDQMALRFPGFAHRHVEFVHGATLFVRRDVFDKVSFTPVRQGTDTIFLNECRDEGLQCYSADPYNFVHMRHADLSLHTWHITDEDFLAKCRVLHSGLDFGEVMI